MTSLPEPIQQLLAALGKLPGLGPRSAERLALHLVQSDPGAVQQLAHAIVEARERIRACPACGALTEEIPCAICADPRREAALLCVVERPVDILSIEKSGTYRGRFHVLGGKISPLNGVDPEDLRITELEARLGAEPIQEIILALSATVDGQSTAHYIADHLDTASLQVTRLAHGMPVGGELDYLDDGTITTALKSRRTA